MPSKVWFGSQAASLSGLVSRPAYDETIEAYLRPVFQQYYTMSFDNYPVELERVEHADVRPCTPAGASP